MHLNNNAMIMIHNNDAMMKYKICAYYCDSDIIH